MWQGMVTEADWSVRHAGTQKKADAGLFRHGTSLKKRAEAGGSFPATRLCDSLHKGAQASSARKMAGVPVRPAQGSGGIKVQVRCLLLLVSRDWRAGGS